MRSLNKSTTRVLFAREFWFLHVSASIQSQIFYFKLCSTGVGLWTKCTYFIREAVHGKERNNSWKTSKAVLLLGKLCSREICELVRRPCHSDCSLLHSSFFWHLACQACHVWWLAKCTYFITMFSSATKNLQAKVLFRTPHMFDVLKAHFKCGCFAATYCELKNCT